METKDKEDHSGHRERLIKKMEKGNLCEHEYLEALLFNAIPRRNTNDLAHRLLSEFGSMHGIFNAPMERLLEVKGVGQSVAAYLHCIGQAIKLYWKEGEMRISSPKFYDKEEFIKYVKREYAGFPFEVLDVYMLDNENRVFLRKRFSVNGKHTVFLLPEEVTKSILDEQPTGIIAVHNHPEGECQPSDADDKATRRLQMICAINNILFCDHLIFTRDNVYSYLSSGKLTEWGNELNEQIGE
jgi:DNA repair protein RadC